MNKINIEKMNNMFSDIKQSLNLDDNFINYMFKRVKKSTDKKDQIMQYVYEYQVQELNYQPLESIHNIFKYYGNVNLLMKWLSIPEYKNILEKIFKDNNVNKDNISESHFNSVGYYTILTQFLKGKLHPCKVCGKYTLNTYCSIKCNKIAQIESRNNA